MALLICCSNFLSKDISMNSSPVISSSTLIEPEIPTLDFLEFWMDWTYPQKANSRGEVWKFIIRSISLLFFLIEYYFIKK